MAGLAVHGCREQAHDVVAAVRRGGRLNEAAHLVGNAEGAENGLKALAAITVKQANVPLLASTPGKASNETFDAPFGEASPDSARETEDRLAHVVAAGTGNTVQVSNEVVGHERVPAHKVVADVRFICLILGPRRGAVRAENRPQPILALNGGITLRDSASPLRAQLMHHCLPHGSCRNCTEHLFFPFLNSRE